MEVKEAIKNRRSIRKYKDKEVSEELIKELLEAAILAPSAYNAQPWKFAIVKDKEVIKKLKVDNVFKNQFVYTAPLIIVCCGDVDSYPERAKENFNLRDLAIGDVSIATHSLVLRATELGLGTCYVGLLSREKIKKLLKIPEKYIISYIVTVGYSDEKPNPTLRKAIEEIRN